MVSIKLRTTAGKRQRRREGGERDRERESHREKERERERGRYRERETPSHALKQTWEEGTDAGCITDPLIKHCLD